MIIDVPTHLEPEEILWEGELEQLGETFRGGEGDARIALGKLKWWRAADALTGQTGEVWNKPVGNRDYTLVRLSCTLYPPRQSSDRYQEVRLHAGMRPMTGRADITAYALFPERITSVREGKLSMKLTPQLKFVDAIDARLGEAGVEISYPYALPVMQAYGQGQSRVEWRFFHQTDHPLIGDLTTFLVADAPAGSNGFWLDLQLSATLQSRFGPIPLGTANIPSQRVGQAIG